MIAPNQIHKNYDAQYDILYIDIGKPCYGYSEEIADDIYLRLDDSNNKPIGFTIISYKQKSKDSLKVLIPFDLDWDYIDSNLN